MPKINKTAFNVFHADEIKERLLNAAKIPASEVPAVFGNTERGYSDEEKIEEQREEYGANQITERKKDGVFKRLAEAFINPFTVVLFVLALIQTFTDVIFTDAAERDYTAVTIIAAMIMISGVLRFAQESRSSDAAAKLKEMVKTTTCVVRNGEQTEIPFAEVVVGDIAVLRAGDMIPADSRIISAKDLFVSQSSLTGESEPIEKTPERILDGGNSPLSYNNLAFMGSNVVSGSARCVVVAGGDDTIFGTVAKSITKKKVMTSFEKGVNSVSWILIRFMLVMVPIVFFANGLTKGGDNRWLNALLFALSVAVGLTPEMLPMIVTTNLAKGAVRMAKKKTVIKNLNSIQNFGAMDILCTDKTGTLTQDRVVLEKYLNVHGEPESRVLTHAYINSFHQTGLKNLMDVAILAHKDDPEVKAYEGRYYVKVDEIPFDFNRRRMSVVVKEDATGKTKLVTKGAAEEILSVCAYAEYGAGREVVPITEELKAKILKTVNGLNDDGMRVIAVAQKNNPAPAGQFSVADESEMVLLGYLAFLDPPKATTRAAISALEEYGVGVKILTGDNDGVTRAVCRQVGLPAEKILLGSDVEAMSMEELKKEVERVSVFAKLSPRQKALIIQLLRENGHVVGYMGDGINDAPAMREADVSISVDTAVDIAKESADIILLEKDLMVLEGGVIEGRKTFGNIIKYIKMTASSNFGNMLSVLAASAFLPFLPMLPFQLLILNLIYDLSCVAIPWDNVDPEFLKTPRKWDASTISKFMLWIGPTSSVFDIATYIVMYFVICPMAAGGGYNDSACNKEIFEAAFHAGWFVESLWSQTLVIHMIRTPKIPFVGSRASRPVLLGTLAAILIGTLLPVIAFTSDMFKFAPLPAVYYAYLAVVIIGYMALVTIFKKIFVRRYGELL